MRPMHTYTTSRADRASLARMGKHNTRREGIALGLAVATTIWVWLALVDALAGEPFYTFATLGGVAAFTVVHYALNVLYAMVVVSAVHGAVRQPSLIIALTFGFVMIQFVFAMISAFLAQVGLGQLAWVRIFGGSLISGAVLFVLINRTHPLAAHLRR